MRLLSTACTLILFVEIFSGFSTATVTKEPNLMMQECRIRAHEIMRTRLPNIETKYEGQRTDGTHAVNGTAWILNQKETFQCSFDKSGNHMTQFIVNNRETDGAKPAPSQLSP